MADPELKTIGVSLRLSRIEWRPKNRNNWRLLSAVPPPEGKRIIFLKKGLTNGKRSDIIIKLTTSAEYMRQCWNWQTGTFEGRVLYDVRVQVPFAAPFQMALKWRKYAVSEFLFLLNYMIWVLLGYYCTNFDTTTQ